MIDYPRAAYGPDRTVRLAAHLLPPGAQRDRYEREFLSELHGMTRTQQTRYALGILARAWSLRMTLRRAPRSVEADGTEHRRIPLSCRLHVHHRWTPQTTEDGGRYVRCARCGKDGDGQYASVDAESLSSGLPGLI